MIELSDAVGVDIIMVVPRMLRSSDGEHRSADGGNFARKHGAICHQLLMPLH